MNIIDRPHYLLALSISALVALGACTKHSAQTDIGPSAAAGAAASSPAAQQVASDGKATEQPDEADENGGGKSASQRSASGTNGPRIKGIALGDSPDAVRVAVTALIPDGSRCHVDEKKDANNPFLNLTIHTRYGIALNCGTAPTQPNYVALFEFKDQALTAFTFGTELSVPAFNAGQMSAKDFAQTFIDAYSIPRLDPSENQQYLTYRDADRGWVVDLFPDKSFKVYAVATASQQTKSFN